MRRAIALLVLAASAAFAQSYNGTGVYPQTVDGSAVNSSTAEREQVNSWLLFNYRAKAAAVAAKTSGTVLTVVHVGDSLTQLNNWTSWLDSWLTGQFGQSGSGWVDISDQIMGRGVLPTGCTFASAGSYTTSFNNGANLGPALADASTTDTVTPATVTVACPAGNTQAVLHYVKGPLEGSFTWQLNGGSANTVSAVAGTLSYGTLTISGMSSTATNTIVLTVTAAGTAGVDWFGLDWQNPNQIGAHIVNLGQGGTQASGWATTNQTMWRAAMTALNPTLTTVMFGVNEAVSSVAPATMTANLSTLFANILAAVPTTDILLQTPGDVSAGGTYTMRQYANAMQDFARTGGYAFVDSTRTLSSYTLANAAGLMTNTTHPNLTGGRVLAELTEAALSPGAAAPLSGNSPLPPSLGGVGAMTGAPMWLRFLGNGAGGAFNCTSTIGAGEWWFTTFTVAVGQTCAFSTTNGTLVIRATGQCTIDGTMTANGLISANGDGGGAGGGGGGGTAAGAVGQGVTINGFSSGGGSAGASSGGTGGNGSAIAAAQQQMIIGGGITGIHGGGAGGAGGTGAATGGKGGGAVVLACGSIRLTGTINANGATGTASAANNNGGGGGGGGGVVILATPTWLANSGTITVTGATGGGCGAFTGCGVGGTGSAGLSTTLTVQ